MTVYNSRISTILLLLPTLERTHVTRHKSIYLSLSLSLYVYIYIYIYIVYKYIYTHTQVLVIFQNYELLRLN